MVLGLFDYVAVKGGMLVGKLSFWVLVIAGGEVMGVVEECGRGVLVGGLGVEQFEVQLWVMDGLILRVVYHQPPRACLPIQQ